jgi:uncharacterized protein YfcZ (UPF0381/DUF406 family)
MHLQTVIIKQNVFNQHTNILESQMDLNEEMKKYMEENKQVFLSEMNKIHERLDKIDNEVEGLKIKLEKHISFIDETYEGLRNPIEGVKRWLGR